MAQGGRRQHQIILYACTTWKEKNFIAIMKVGDRILTTHEDKAAEILEFYTGLIGTDYARERTIDLDMLNIPGHNLDALEISFNEDEVWDTIKQLPSDKAPGPTASQGGFISLVGQSSSMM
jgi:hypothetical protein